jgi:hypothetical protein
MVCPICLQVGEAAVSYELDQLVKHIARRHPLEGLLITVVGAILIAWGGPKVLRSLKA